MKLADYRAREGLSVADFAELIEVSPFSVRRYEDDRIPTADVMKRIIEVTKGQVTANDFFSEAA